MAKKAGAKNLTVPLEPDELIGFHVAAKTFGWNTTEYVTHFVRDSIRKAKEKLGAEGFEARFEAQKAKTVEQSQRRSSTESPVIWANSPDFEFPQRKVADDGNTRRNEGKVPQPRKRGGKR